MPNRTFYVNNKQFLWEIDFAWILLTMYLSNEVVNFVNIYLFPYFFFTWINLFRYLPLANLVRIE